MADWINELPRQQAKATIKDRALSFFSLEAGGRPIVRDVAIAATISAIATVLILVLLRPPLCVYKTKMDEAHYAPSLKAHSLVGWAIVAALATVFLCIL